MAQVKITQVKSVIDRTKRQKETMYALGLRRMHQTVVKDLNPQVEGMINKIKHLVKIEEV